MRPAFRSPRRQAASLALAGLACFAQCLGGLLPEPVVCLRNDRPAQAELFTHCCSCQHEAPDLGEPALASGRRSEPGCVDVLLASPALLAAPGGAPGPADRRSEPAPLPPTASAIAAGWSPHGRGSPPGGIPFPPSLLRC